ncbi:hypothetical protein ASPNIDRAFT_49473 [Aspergillus niger ATCC 1015]|uniref:SRP9 domain-containing protein n=1 Tax=Aspergillus niger (strain ATCC 1015 / CBS 113.46 / FGSC A1144 / LSHB Ac4 / NCTC 3858a / NRRL 328 / USDA 3528.7) TaxID=380704 RepID=G3XP92_ASPNA|nr:hypothetical protein ASPNIDRAFT_49473 [Aspergillus niger ATCC 1015]KAI3015791.1 hypothetical protein CBS147345_4786 [Aspergillus niger]SPB42911.1 unnamed protein product [Aspergillus niger]
MPYLPTSQSYLEQSSLLLQAYPDTRITTKYTFPRTTSTSTSTKQQQQQQQPTSTEDTEPKPRIATLELKTYHPGSGICLKYRTNKGAEVGRLITSLGKLAAGADFEGLGLSNPTAAAAPADVEMGDALAPPAGAAGGNGEGQTVVAGDSSNAGGAGKGGKGKKKGGKGKR